MCQEIQTSSATIAEMGLRVWTPITKKMIYCDNRYSIINPAYMRTFATVIDFETKVKKEIYMLRVEEPSIENRKGIFDQDIIRYEFKGEIKEGIVYYDKYHMMWVVTYDDKRIPLYKAENRIVIGNVFEK